MDGGGAVTPGELADQLLELLGEEDPPEATLSGIPGHDHHLRDLSEAADERFRARALDIAAEAERLSPSVTRSVVLQQAHALVDKIDSRLLDHVVADFITSPAIKLLSFVPRVVPLDEQGERAYLSRIAEIPAYLEALADRNRAGIQAGRTPVARPVRTAIAHIDRYLAEPVDVFTNPKLTGERSAERDRVVAEGVRPAFAKYRDVLENDVLPHARPDERPGLYWLPGGQEAYAGLVRFHTTTDVTPEQLHQTGLDIIAALADEYATIGAKVFGLNSATEVMERLRTDHSLRWRSEDEALTHARVTIERAEAVAPKWFGRLPSKRCTVEPVPPAEGPNAAGAYYSQPALDGSREGTYFLNTYRVEERDRYVAESVAFHEAVPGHHFQLALAQELTHLHLLRRVVSITAYSEGWALYTERLADEMGLYSDDLARLGMLAEDSMRAARLVVDTGLHAFGWTRQQVVDYLRANTVMSEVEVQSETDRYIEDAGQALAYMVGRLEIQRLRAHAERVLGDAFDIREFHDLVLCGGPLPLAVLDEVVRSRCG
jgi:uncharacterized protein (DUF885 family)